MKYPIFNPYSALVALLFLASSAFLAGAGEATIDTFTFDPEPGRLVIRRNAQVVATYVFHDEQIPRPHFANVRTPSGIPLTRNQPPIAGQDPTDHDTYHPGIWLAFADINGQDYWRNKARVEHVKFLEAPRGAAGQGGFAVVNRCLDTNGTSEICRETTRFTFLARPHGTLLRWESELSSAQGDLSFEVQEDRVPMGLGVRVASPIRVQGGNGTIRNSRGEQNEAGTWGKEADWWDYSGTVNQRHIGILLVPSPANTFKSWGHTRDYGSLLANPFPRPLGKETVRTLIKKGEKLRLHYAILLHESPADAVFDLRAAVEDCQRCLQDR